MSAYPPPSVKPLSRGPSPLSVTSKNVALKRNLSSQRFRPILENPKTSPPGANRKQQLNATIITRLVDA
ncbi:hypothetical protein BYT27DRAFT_7265517 [Phlegmacium glaucopus]|nr:hypothetical protein BYT27DRAFT_7265517 [Phlegmacium glaucopus]